MYRGHVGGQRGFLAIVGGIVVLLVATVAIVVLRGDPPTATYPAGSPEAAFQAYLTAWVEGDDATAYASFTTEVRAATSLETYHRQSEDFRQSGFQPGSSRRVFIDSATIRGETATLQLTVETTVVSGLSANRYRARTTVPMAREDGAWKLDRIRMGTEPWWADKL
jgi:hypothetical protein